VALAHVGLICERRVHKMGIALLEQTLGGPTPAAAAAAVAAHAPERAADDPGSADRVVDPVLVAAAAAAEAAAAAGPTLEAPTKMLSYAGSAILARLRHLANPITLNCPPLDLDVEDHATLAPQAVVLARQSLDALESLLVIEALLATQMLASSERARWLGAGTAPLYEAVAQLLAPPVVGATSAELVEVVRARLRQPL
jgi:histidine ammonia-lyase